MHKDIQAAGMLVQQGRPEEAIVHLKSSLKEDPLQVEISLTLQSLYRSLGKTQEAIEVLSTAAPHVDVFNSLGILYSLTNQVDLAATTFYRALQIDPNYHMAFVNLGKLYHNANDFKKAESFLRLAVAHAPGNPLAAYNLAETLLAQEQYDMGWRLYERRWDAFPQLKQASNQLDDKKKLKYICTDIPCYSKDDLTIVAYCEQGLGDFIQFSRYLKQIKCKDLAVLCEPQHRAIFEGMNLKTTIDPFKYDRHVSVCSLPMLLGPAFKHSPSVYIASTTPHKELEKYSGLKIGICWAGRPSHLNDHNRSCYLKYFKDIASIPGVSIISLQKDCNLRHWQTVGQVDLNEGDFKPNVIPIRDMADTMSIISGLDLVVTVDTVIAHLAGAMGKKVFVLLPYSPDWRWMAHMKENDSYSPWYVDTCMIRQNKPGNWKHIFKNLEVNIKTHLARVDK